MPLITLTKEILDPLNELQIKLERPEYTKSLSELLLRVATTYVDPSDYIKVLHEKIGFFENDVDIAMKYREKFLYVLEELNPEQVVVIANAGLPLCSMASYYGYDTRIIEAHRISHPAWKYVRKKDIEWRSYGDYNYDDLYNFRQKIRGIMEIDQVKAKCKTIIVDEFCATGLTVRAVIDHLKRKEINVEKVVLPYSADSFENQDHIDYIFLKK